MSNSFLMKGYREDVTDLSPNCRRIVADELDNAEDYSRREEQRAALRGGPYNSSLLLPE
jgi:hypothetical protein